MTKSEKEDYIMMCLSKSMKPHGVTNNLGRNFLLGQLIGEQMDCSECPVEGLCEKDNSVHYCSEFIRDNFILVDDQNTIK